MPVNVMCRRVNTQQRIRISIKLNGISLVRTIVCVNGGVCGLTFKSK